MPPASARPSARCGADVRVESIQHVFAELEKIAATGEVGETYRYLDVRE